MLWLLLLVALSMMTTAKENSKLRDIVIARIKTISQLFNLPSTATAAAIFTIAEDAAPAAVEGAIDANCNKQRTPNSSGTIICKSREIFRALRYATI